MAMTMEEAVSKAAKLMKLAQSDNPNEAALAAARAQDIIDRYKLSGVDLSLDPERRREDEEPVRTLEAPLDDVGTVQVPLWRGRLAVVLARANQCHVFAEGGVIKLIGRATDAEAVRYLFAYLAGEVDRLTKRDGYGNGRAWANNFRVGCVDTIDEKLKAQHAATVDAVKAENPNAIVLVQNSLARLEKRAGDVERYVAQAYPRLTKKRTSARLVVSAREAGRKSAQEIGIGGGKGLGAGHKQLGGG